MNTYNKRIYGQTKNISTEELKSKFNSSKLSYIKLAILFGSRVNGDNHSKSDYDFAVLSDNIDSTWGIEAKYWDDISSELDIFDYDLDIINLQKAQKNILNSIKENYIILKGEDSELQRLFDTNI